MKKTISLFIGASMALSTLPAFAQDASSSSSSSVSSVSSSSSSVSSSSVSSSSSSVSSKPCANLKGLELNACRIEQLKKTTPAASKRQNSAAHARIELCRSKRGLEKALCLRRSMNKAEDKMEKIEDKLQNMKNILEKKNLRKVIKFNRRTDKEALKASRGRKSSSSSSMSSTSSSSSSSSSVSSSSSSN